MDLGGGVTHTIRMYLNSEIEIIERARMRFFIAAGWTGKRESDIVRLERRLVDCFPHEHARTRARGRGRTRTTECVFRRLFRCDRSAASSVMRRPIESGRERRGGGRATKRKRGMNGWLVGRTGRQTDRGQNQIRHSLIMHKSPCLAGCDFLFTFLTAFAK